jgi:hypothetical protein
MEVAGERRGAIRVRRSRRADFPAVRALLGTTSAARDARFAARTLGALAGDVYVAQEGQGPLRGIVVLGYVRSLADGRWVAILDGVWSAPGWEAVLGPLVTHAEARARQRGCRRIVVASETVPEPVRALLACRAYTERPALVGTLDAAG